MQVPCMGNKQSEDQDENTSPKEEHQEQYNQKHCQRPYIVVPHYQGLSESIKRTCDKYGGTSPSQGRCYHQEPPGGPKDQDPILKKSGVIYTYKCDRVDCDEEYKGESSRTFGERFKEHQKAPSPYI